MSVYMYAAYVYVCAYEYVRVYVCMYMCCKCVCICECMCVLVGHESGKKTMRRKKGLKGEKKGDRVGNWTYQSHRQKGDYLE